MRIVSTILVGVSLSYSLFATDYRPWFGRTLEIEVQGNVQAQAYRSIDSDAETVYQPACDLFFDLGANSSYNDFAGEMECVLTDTRYRTFGMDSIKLTARMRWLNDIVADTVSLVSGISVSQVFKPGLRNLSSFHHGGIECELHVAAGKEYSHQQFWKSRWWSVLGMGIADMGYPWVRGDLAWEYNFCERHEVRLFANSLWGLGHKPLDLQKSFHGYGPIRHQFVDTGIRYSRIFTFGGTLGIEYAYRVFARNCPKGVSIVLVTFSYPFGL